MGTNCAPLVADLFCYERDFLLSLKLPNSDNFLSVEIDDCRSASYDPEVTHI